MKIELTRLAAALHAAVDNPKPIAGANNVMPTLEALQMARIEALGALYIEMIGYDPSEDHSAMTQEEMFDILMQWLREQCWVNRIELNTIPGILPRITRGMRVHFKSGWQDSGDRDIEFRAQEDEDGGRVLVQAQCSLRFNPIQSVPTSMIERVGESELNLRKALTQAEAIPTCMSMPDESERGEP